MIRIGIICPSEIAYRRFLPAVSSLKNRFCYVGVAIANPAEWFGDLSHVTKEQIENQQSIEQQKVNGFIQDYGGDIFRSYEEMVCSPKIDAIYIPLPPALHYKWAKYALEQGKHVMVEKPLTCYLKDTEHLISIADDRNLALHENYMFVFHDQVQAIKNIIINEVEVGKPRLYRISFGFPRRAANDFRYNKKLGGGALLDAGGYTLRYATELLGSTARIVAANVTYDSDFEVEIFGAATVVNDEGMIVQTAFGMDNDYRCDIEIWGNKGTLTSNRILTAPIGFVPTYTLKQNQEYIRRNLPEDDAFCKSLLRFANAIEDMSIRTENYKIIEMQASLLESFRNKSGLK